jgi:hypothetical protein
MRKQTMGRPSICTNELAAQICDRLAAGESLNAICRDEHMPSRKVVHEWVADDRDGFRDKYARAREAQAEYWASEIIEIADSVRTGATSEEVQAARLAVDSRKWVASRLLPRKYGDRVTNIHGSDPENPLKTVNRIEVVLVRPGDRGADSLPP